MEIEFENLVSYKTGKTITVTGQQDIIDNLRRNDRAFQQHQNKQQTDYGVKK